MEFRKWASKDSTKCDSTNNVIELIDIVSDM